MILNLKAKGFYLALIQRHRAYILENGFSNSIWGIGFNM